MTPRRSTAPPAPGAGSPRRRAAAPPAAAPSPAWPSLGDILGHAEAVARLHGALAAGRLGHALLLTGPGQVGATTLCLGLAGALLPRGSWPGGLVTHPDLWVEDGDQESIRIDRVRAGREPGSLQEFLSLRPYSGGVRVAILARADRLTEQAANSLLKTIEEPPPESHLLITAASAEALPATIVSRCQRASLTLVASGEIEAWLGDRHGVPAAIAAEAAELAAGRPGRALRLAGDPAARARELALLDQFLAACRGDGPAALTASRELAPPAGAEGRERLLLCLSLWASFVRDAAAASAGAPELSRWHSRAVELDRWVATTPPDRASRVLDSLIAAVPAVVANAHPRLLLDVLLLGIRATLSSS